MFNANPKYTLACFYFFVLNSRSVQHTHAPEVSAEIYPTGLYSKLVSVTRLTYKDRSLLLEALCCMSG